MAPTGGSTRQAGLFILQRLALPDVELAHRRRQGRSQRAVDAGDLVADRLAARLAGDWRRLVFRRVYLRLLRLGLRGLRRLTPIAPRRRLPAGSPPAPAACLPRPPNLRKPEHFEPPTTQTASTKETTVFFGHLTAVAELKAHCSLDSRRRVFVHGLCVLAHSGAPGGRTLRRSASLRPAAVVVGDWLRTVPAHRDTHETLYASSRTAWKKSWC